MRSRRHLLQAGMLSGLGMGLADWFAATDVRASATVAKPAKACIFLFMWGGPSQLETFDMKPDAPAEVRGSFNPVSTRVAGMPICEHFTHLAQMTDKLAIVRSLSHDDPAHLSSGHAAVTGQPAPVVKSDATPPSNNDSPHLGSLVSKLRPSEQGVPSFVTLPWKALHPAAPGGEAPGQHGGWLGPAHDGLLLTGDPNAADWKPSSLALPADMSLARLESRVTLLKQLDAQRRQMESDAPLLGRGTDDPTATLRQHQQRAHRLLASPHVRKAFDLAAEPEKVRQRYGRNIHGQSVLMARRLVEHGVPLVSVNWHNDGRNFWDTHVNNFNRLKDDLIPPSDRALSALLEDLEQRGMLDETLVVWVGEFGRKPQINPANAGREHWPFCYSGLMAGGGIRGGTVYGASDKLAAHPIRDPVSPYDFGTTIVHALGMDPETYLPDREGRPRPITAGKVIHPLFTG
ncbi:DUF1501 domain-containing protein [Roseimaritima sediminicola]|uniref:DUF1501 domain-containing protein n=1 Tax=Roseimaritima sediminicola TaxID=2662066 RepID=UPI00192A6253|nr:DUF1501 domain-containing protein [Roseimaritima sediminicola]